MIFRRSGDVAGRARGSRGRMENVIPAGGGREGGGLGTPGGERRNGVERYPRFPAGMDSRRSHLMFPTHFPRYFDKVFDSCKERK